MIQSADSGITSEEVCQATPGFVTASDIFGGALIWFCNYLLNLSKSRSADSIAASDRMGSDAMRNLHYETFLLCRDFAEDEKLFGEIRHSGRLSLSMDQ